MSIYIYVLKSTGPKWNSFGKHGSKHCLVALAEQLHQRVMSEVGGIEQGAPTFREKLCVGRWRKADTGVTFGKPGRGKGIR